MTHVITLTVHRDQVDGLDNDKAVNAHARAFAAALQQYGWEFCGGDVDGQSVTL